MKSSLPLSDDKKLFVIYRVEPGCLGPQGRSHIAEFCLFAETELVSLNSDCIAWSVEPRNDKTLPEMQYTLADRRISPSQAQKYLAVFDKVLDDIECALGDKLDALIEQYMSR